MRGILSQPQYFTTKTEPQVAIADWLRAVENFHCCYQKLSKIINERTSLNSSTSMKPTSLSRRIKGLIKTRQYMKDVLETLLLDMNTSTVIPSYANDSARLSKAGQLVTHAQLLAEVSQKINDELAYFAIAQA